MNNIQVGDHYVDNVYLIEGELVIFKIIQKLEHDVVLEPVYQKRQYVRSSVLVSFDIIEYDIKIPKSIIELVKVVYG